jgi:hypothetical protein
MDLTEVMMVYGGFFALMIMMLATIRTNMMTELRAAMMGGGKVVWFLYSNKKPKLVRPDKVDSKGVYFKNKGKHVMEFYPLKHTSWIPMGPINVALIVEGISYPIDLRFIELAMRAKKLAKFPDYTQMEVACCLKNLEHELGEPIDVTFINKPQDLTQDGENYRHYKRGIDWVKEQVVNMTGDPWTFSATDAEVKRSLSNENYKATKDDFGLLEDFRNWINRNASTHDIEDLQTSVRVATQEDALFGKGILGNIPAMQIVLILIGLGIAYVLFSQGGGINTLIPSGTTATTLHAPNLIPI